MNPHCNTIVQKKHSRMAPREESLPKDCQIPASQAAREKPRSAHLLSYWKHQAPSFCNVQEH